MPSVPSRPGLSNLPSVDELLRSETAKRLLNDVGQKRLTEYARSILSELRSELKVNPSQATKQELLRTSETMLEQLWLSSQKAALKRVINATGVVIHTNLGRAPLSEAAKQALIAASGYCNIEYDLLSGSRGSRGGRTESLVCELTGAEDAIVVNNCAAAAYLVLTALAVGREAVISRGELVEIGGEFRIPDVLARAGVTLKEVGTTNRTKISDYEKAITERTAMILKVHPSNYRIVGFTASPSVSELSELAHNKRILLYEDAGSGAVADLTDIGLADEPVISESLKAGADIVTFSGDKLLGGPHAGIIIGSDEAIGRLRRHPLTRAVRPDKATIAGLRATLLHFLHGEAESKVPVWQMIGASTTDLHERAARVAGAVPGAEVMPTEAAVGGGSTPGETLPSWAVAAPGLGTADGVAAQLRRWRTPIVGRVSEERVLLDLRTVDPRQDQEVIDALRALCSL